MEKFQVTFDSESMNEYLKKSILDSTIGKILHEELERKLKDYDLRRAIAQAIDKEVICAINRAVQDYLSTQNELLRNVIREAATDEAITQMANKAWERLLRN